MTTKEEKKANTIRNIALVLFGLSALSALSAPLLIQYEFQNIYRPIPLIIFFISGLTLVTLESGNDIRKRRYKKLKEQRKAIQEKRNKLNQFEKEIRSWRKY